jgi:hypothetical protein
MVPVIWQTVIDTRQRKEVCMIKFRHLIWMTIAAAGLMLSVSQSFAQQPDVDQPGLLPDNSVELDPD